MRRHLLTFTALLCGILAAPAQYPIIPDSTKLRGERTEKRIAARRDSIWQRVLPTVMAEDAAGRIYRPGASHPDELLKSDIPAFPGAEGGGMYTAGGRGGRVIVVTNLNDSGEGSFRWAVEQGGARIVVFNVAGIIRLKTPVDIEAPYLTIAGQSAPGEGVCITGESVHINTHDVIIRYMRFRRGARDVAFRDDALGGNAVGNIIIDHCSGSWGLDEVISLYRHVYRRDPVTGRGEKLPTVNITIQNSMFCEAMDTYNHAFGATIGGENNLFARNLFACNISRNCSIGMGSVFNFVNNVVFNWWNRSVDGGGQEIKINLIGNYYKPGPITPTDQPIGCRIAKIEGKNGHYGTAYAASNLVCGNKRVSADNWDGGIQIEGAEMADQIDRIRRLQPFEMPYATLMSAKQAYRFVLKHVGATLPVRDAVDARIIRTVRTGKAAYAADAARYEGNDYVKRRLPADSYKQGIITDIRQVGGLPEYRGEPYPDSDSDGMPDWWEERYGLDPNDPADAVQDCNGDGYTNIEKFINHIDPDRKVDWRDLKNNRDTTEEIESLHR